MTIKHHTKGDRFKPAYERPTVHLKDVLDRIKQIMAEFESLGCKCELVGGMKTCGYSAQDVDIVVKVVPGDWNKVHDLVWKLKNIPRLFGPFWLDLDLTLG